MKNRSGAGLSLVLALAACGCSGSSSTNFNERPGTGGQGSGGDGAAGGSGGDGATDGSGGDGATGGASTGGTGGDGAASGAGAAGGSGGSAGSMSSGGRAGSGEGGEPSAGSAGTPSAGSAGMVNVPGIINGTWSMFAWEDPVQVTLTQQGDKLVGTGCCAGNGGIATGDCCGEITGTILDHRAEFSFPAGDFGSTYMANVYISEDAERMGGDFGVNEPTGRKMAWARPDATRGGWLPADTVLSEAVGTNRSGDYALLLLSQRADRFVPDTEYRLVVDVRPDRLLVWGDFGPFYNDEMTWDADGQTLTLGPVPATDPSLAIELGLQFSGELLSRVIVLYEGDDGPYVFSVKAPPL